MNDIKLQEGHPVDENLRPLKVGGKSTALETAQHGNGARVNGSLEVTGFIPTVTTNRIKTVTANDGIIIDSGKGITLDATNGAFIASKAGTEFSVANSAYAGMILGYTRIQNDSSTTGYAEISPTATLPVLQTDAGTDVSVTFVAPPSGNVEISMLCAVYSSSKTLEFALSDNATFNEVDETHTYDAGAQSSDETDQNMTYVSFVNTGLTAGTEYTRWIAAAETVSGVTAIRHGRNRTTGFHYPPIIVKAIALPATITTGE